MMKAYALKMKHLSNNQTYYLANEGNCWIFNDPDRMLDILFLGIKGKKYILKQAQNPSKDEKFVLEQYEITKKGETPIIKKEAKKWQKS